MHDVDPRARADEVLEHGFTVLEGLLPPALIDECAAAFKPILDDYTANHDHDPNRGAHRHFIKLPMTKPFMHPDLYENPAILNVVECLLGEDLTIVTYATDTPLQGSVHQDTHSDIQPLFPGSGLMTPPYVIAVNFSYVDVTPENGPFEVARGTHRIPKDEGLAGIESGEIPLEPLCLQIGDVLIRDPRCLHRGTPNQTSTPRPVAVITHTRAWYRFNHIDEISQRTFESLSERAQRLFRHVPLGS